MPNASKPAVIYFQASGKISEQIRRGTKMDFSVRCYAYGSGSDWQAICVDFNIAVGGESLQEARDSLNSCIQMYLERVAELPKNEQAQFLNRKSPWHVRIRLACMAWLSSLRSHSAFQEFSIPSHFPALP